MHQFGGVFHLKCRKQLFHVVGVEQTRLTFGVGFGVQGVWSTAEIHLALPQQPKSTLPFRVDTCHPKL